jgi:hypothetical protein
VTVEKRLENESSLAAEQKLSNFRQEGGLINLCIKGCQFKIQQPSAERFYLLKK